MAFSEKLINNIPLYVSDLIPYRHGFTSRRGGVSVGGFSSMNIGEKRGDNPEHVRENYQRVADALEFDLEKLVYTRQVHGTEVTIVTSKDSRELFSPMDFERDGLATKEKGLPIHCMVADCVPVLLCDDVNGVVSAVHCGWRSSVGDILAVALEQMVKLGAEPKNIKSAIGVAIGKCCFEVDNDVVDAMKKWLGEDAMQFVKEKHDKKGKFLVDLRSANKFRLVSLGVLSENIDICEECTMCRPDKFWSHRASADERGNMAAFIVL